MTKCKKKVKADPRKDPADVVGKTTSLNPKPNDVCD